MPVYKAIAQFALPLFIFFSFLSILLTNSPCAFCLVQVVVVVVVILVSVPELIYEF